CGRPMTSAEVQALIADRLITIGAHTVSHRALSCLGSDARQHEIVESKRACEALAGTPVSGFSYPYGDYDDAARSQVMAAGFSFACATMQGTAKANSDIFALPRIQVLNWGGDAFEHALRQSGG